MPLPFMMCGLGQSSHDLKSVTLAASTDPGWQSAGFGVESM